MSSHLFTYAIGDIYGDHALLTTLLDRIHDHADGEDYRLVILGNAIDHGPNGNAVLSALRAMELRAPDRVVTLRGAHEAMMTDARGDAEAFAIWQRNGGDATLRSFGVSRHAELPRELVDWVARRPMEFRDGLRRYVSAPSSADDRPDSAAPGLHLVHGASAGSGEDQTQLPAEHVGRTGIDTGAGFGGRLTAALFTDLQASPVGFVEALADGTTQFLPPSRSVAQPWDPRLALKLVDGEPETAAAWSIRQDADLVAARMAQARRDRRRNTAWGAAAALVVVLVGTGLLIRPALTYLARSMAPADAGRQVAATPAPAIVPAPQPVAAPERAAAMTPEPAAEALAPEAPAEAPLRTHALPDSSGTRAEAPAGPGPLANEPSTTAAATPAPEPHAPPEGLPPQDSSVVEAPAARPAATPVASLPTTAEAAVPPAPETAGPAPAAFQALPTLALADGAILGEDVSDGTHDPILPQTFPALSGANAFVLAVEPSRRVGWRTTSDGDDGLARLGLHREAAVAPPAPAPGGSVNQAALPSATVEAPPATVPQAAGHQAKPKAKPKPKVAAVPHPVKRSVAAPPAQADEAARDGGPIDLRALMNAPQVGARPRRGTASRPAAPIDPMLEPEGAGQP